MMSDWNKPSPFPRGGSSVEPFELDDVLDEGVFAALSEKPSRGLVYDSQWVYENAMRFRSLLRGCGSVNAEKAGASKELLREFLLGAPGSGAIRLLKESEQSREAMKELLRTLGKSDDADEVALRERSSKKRFGVIEALCEAGPPKAPWLNRFGELIDG